jgi:hypothetical protein
MAFVGGPDWQGKRLDVAVTRMQVEASPYVDTHQPVTRQHEVAYLGYYAYPCYWEGSDVWGSASNPVELKTSTNPPRNSSPQAAGSHLHGSQDVAACSIEATDGELGPIESLVFDDQSWAIRYIEVATHSWWPGKKVLVSPSWIQRISWTESRVYVEFSRETIKNGPEYNSSAPINREFENRLYAHYGRAPYWTDSLPSASTARV